MIAVTSQQMKQIEENSLQYDMTFHDLMEYAGVAAWQSIRSKISVSGRQCLIFAGKGNNGGDGYVVARKLHEDGAVVAVVLTDGLPVTPDAQVMFKIVREMGIPIYSYDEDKEQIYAVLEETDIVVDAVFGTGFHGELDTRHKEICTLINRAIAAVFCLDIPTGISADTAQCDADAVSGDFTIVFDSYKPAHLFYKTLPKLGSVELVSIGIDPRVKENTPILYTLPQEEEIFAHLKPKDPCSHKGNNGRVLCIGGSMGMAGALVLAVKGAQRTGAGYVTAAMPHSIYPLVSPQVPTATAVLLQESVYGTVGENCVTALVEPLKRADVVLMGCGLGQQEEVTHVVGQIVTQSGKKLVLDADALNCIAADPSMLREAKSTCILTPHVGEMARLLGCTQEAVYQSPLKAALTFAQQYGVVVVLKGPNTVIASADGEVSVNPTGNAGMAKAGSGDVLTGMIASLWAQGLTAMQAAQVGVYLHGLAGDLCAERLSQYYMQPTDMLEDLSGIFQKQGL